MTSATLRHAAPHRTASILTKLKPERAGPIVAELEQDMAASVLRRIDEAARQELLAALAPGPARSLKSLLRFPEGTAGALMDPNVLALPGDLTADDAHAHIRESPENVRYNLYVVDREQVLIGVLNLRELLLARRKDLLRSIAHPEVLSIRADADRHVILDHPAWNEARSVPVVDEHGLYLGAVRYQTMRRLEEELRAGDGDGGVSTVDALGDLFSTGVVGVFGALTGFPRAALSGE